MKPVRFNPQIDLAPLPFDPRLLPLARQLKQLGLPWTPHVGCFVWDPDRHIPAESPFPERIYFILSLPRFLDIFGRMEDIRAKLVWLPTWHQARLLAARGGLPRTEIKRLWQAPLPKPGDELVMLYQQLIETLRDAP